MSSKLLILASASPQRKDLLAGLGLDFSVVTSSIDESACEEMRPAERAVLLARMKAMDVRQQHQESIIIGCDTLVVASDGSLLEKPSDEDEAMSMLHAQSGKTSIVHSAVCVVDSEGEIHEGLSSSAVTFKTLSDDEMQWWVKSGLWRDRSGGFQIDGLGQLMIERIEGDWTGIVGLPIFLLGQLLEKALGQKWKIES